MRKTSFKLLLCVLGCFFMQSAWADSSADKQAIAQKLIRTEPKVKDAYWSNGSTLLVGVLDDGSRRDGYASYVCEVLYEEGLRGKAIFVKVIDILKIVKENSRVVLGEARCR
jgi:hypothetical protein